MATSAIAASESADALGEDVEVGPSSSSTIDADESTDMAVDPVDVDHDDVDLDEPLHLEDEDTGEVVMSDPEAGPSHEGKRVKVRL